MNCIRCGGKTTISSSRQNKAGTIYKKYRKCASCGLAFKSYELSDLDIKDYVEDIREIEHEIEPYTRTEKKPADNSWIFNKI